MSKRFKLCDQSILDAKTVLCRGLAMPEFGLPWHVNPEFIIKATEITANSLLEIGRCSLSINSDHAEPRCGTL